MSKSIVVSGIRPTGFLHLGSYFGALRNYVRMQEEYDCYFFIADWHSLTTHPDTRELKNNIYRVLAEYIASGLDPQKACLYVQSTVPEITELYLLLNTLAYKGELEKTVTFKDKARQQPDNVNAGLLTYPVLQAADIIIHRATLVPVGKDQEQHLEMCRNFVQRFNSRYKNIFPEPYAFNFGADLIKVASLDGEGKMSKSENQYATIYLNDADDLIRKKLMKAKSDMGPAHPETPMSKGVQNLFHLMKLVSAPSTSEFFEKEYAQGVIRYGDMKKQLAEDMILFVNPIRERAATLLNDEQYLNHVIREGAEKARQSAQKTLSQVKEAIGLIF